MTTLLLLLMLRAEQPLATYPGAVHTRIGGTLVVGGEPYRLAYFFTGDSMKKVARWFVKGWEAQGYPVTVDGDFVSEGTVSAFFTREGLVRSIVLRRHEGRTLGFTVLKDLWSQPEAADARDRLPALEGALFSTEGAEGGSRQRTTLLEKNVQAARDALAAAWAKAGYVNTRETRVEKGRVLELQSGKRQVVISLIAIDAQTTGIAETRVEGHR